RLGEKLQWNAQPATADEALEYWRVVLNVPQRSSDEDWQVRQDCAAAYKTFLGPTIQGVEETVQEQLGDRFVRTIRYVGDSLSSPPVYTYWNGTGPSEWNLGGGTWASVRSRLQVEAGVPADSELGEFLNDMDRLSRTLDTFLPAWMTYDWSTGVTDGGFRLDFDRLDFGGLGGT
ncbi:MAG: hypothetical protein ACYTBJ_25910, partial [Planctomycetota bacterium]